MFPIALDITKIAIFLIGKGEAYEKRKRQLEEAGAAHLRCHTALVAGSGATYPWQDSVIVMVAGLDYSTSEIIATQARAEKKMVNVEDVNELCDFYFTAHITRGDLQIAVSTNGASPTLAKRVRDSLAKCFGEEWKEHTQSIKAFREKLRSEGKSMREVQAATEVFLDEQAWTSVCARMKGNQ